MTGTPHADGGSDGDGSTLRLTYPIDDDESPSTAVVRAVSALTDTSPLDLDPLYDAIDPDHLDGTLEGVDGEAARVEISFRYRDCAITVTPDEVRARVVTE